MTGSQPKDISIALLTVYRLRILQFHCDVNSFVFIRNIDYFDQLKYHEGANKSIPQVSEMQYHSPCCCSLRICCLLHPEQLELVLVFVY